MIGIIELLLLALEAALAIYWFNNPGSNIEPIIVFIGIILVGLDINRRKQHPQLSSTEQTNGLTGPSKIDIKKRIIKSNPKSDWSLNYKGLNQIAVFNNDANLRIEMSDDAEEIQNSNFQEPWANNHPDNHAVGYWCRIYYGSTLIESIVLVSVDGAMAQLPLPERTKSLHHPGNIPIFNYKIAKVFDSLDTLDEYIKRSGLSVETGMA